MRRDVSPALWAAKAIAGSLQVPGEEPTVSQESSRGRSGTDSAPGHGSDGGAQRGWDGERPEAVVLDLNLNGKLAIDLAEAFVARQIPFLVLTGYGHRQFDVPALQKAPRLHKPVDPQELVRTLSDLVRAAD